MPLQAFQATHENFNEPATVAALLSSLAWMRTVGHVDRLTLEDAIKYYGRSTFNALTNGKLAYLCNASVGDRWDSYAKRHGHDPQFVTPSPVVELAMCEQEHLVLKPDQLYVFRVMPGCARCEALAVRSDLNGR